SFSGLEEFMNEPIVSEPIVKKHVAENSKAKISEEKPKAVKKNNDAPNIEDWVSDDKEEEVSKPKAVKKTVVSQPKVEKKTVKPSFEKIKFVKSKPQTKTARKTVNHVEQNRQNTHSKRGNQRNWKNVNQVENHRQNTHSPRGNQRNWNNMMSQKLGSNFVMFNKACYVCGSFDHLQGNLQMDLQDQGVIDSGCSRHMTENMSYLTDYEEIDGGYVAFEGNPKGRKITGKGTQSNGFAGTKASDNACQARKETEHVKDYILISLWTADPPYSQDPKSCHYDGSKPSSDDGKKVNAVGGKTSIELSFVLNMLALEDYRIFDFARDEDDGLVADMNNLDKTIQVSPILTTGIHKDHPLDQKEPKKVIHALKDPSWIEAMQEELLQFKNKKDERGIVIRNKARLVAQGYTQEESIDYDEVFAPVANVKAVRLFLAYASFKDFVVYQMDVKNDFFYGKIEEEVYVCQPPGFEDPHFLIEFTRLQKHCMDYIKLLELGKAKKSVRLMIGMLFQMELELMLMIQRLIEVRAATTASSLEAEQDSGGASNMGVTIAQTRFENVSKLFLMIHCSQEGRIDAIDADEEITLVSVNDANVSAGEEVFVKEQEVADEMEVVEEAVEVINTAKLIIDATQVSVVGDTVSAATTTAATNVDDITLAQALEEMKSTIHAERGVVYKRWGESTTTKIFQKLSSQLFQRYIVQEQRRVVMKKLLYVSTTLREKKNSLLQLKEQKRKETNHQQKLTEGKNNVYLPNEHEGYKLKFENSGGGGKRDEVGLSRLQENTIEAKGWKRQRNVELKQLMEIIPDEEEVSIDSIPLAVKSPNLHVGREEVSPCTIYTFNDLEKKLMIDYESETAYHLLKFIVKQLKK
ncbi:putative ribonuclease H-like domain-containing protein, partial [Tanacetum coccineum]